jgi:Domain of unknown function (DUF4917)
VPGVLSFDKAITVSRDKPISVLLGNGFSIAQAGRQFNYANLLERAGLPEGGCIRNVFHLFKIVDFEEVMRALEHAAKIEEAYDNAERSMRFQQDSDQLRESLIHAVRAVHPETQFEIPQNQVDSCAKFLRSFQYIFTLNYDLLMYWVMLRAKIHSDGFGLGRVADGFRTFETGADCTVSYLHGALHLFPWAAG